MLMLCRDILGGYRGKTVVIRTKPRGLDAHTMMGTSPLNPQYVKRPPEQQRQVNQESAHLALYFYESCDTCIRIIRLIERLCLRVELRNIRNVPAFRDHLLHGTGRQDVPCLIVQEQGEEPRWISEADEIIAYLEKRFT